MVQKRAAETCACFGLQSAVLLEQAAFLSYALGGTKEYEGNGNMTAAHQRLVNDMGMRMEHFDIVLEHLGASLDDLNVPQVCMATPLAAF